MRIYLFLVSLVFFLSACGRKGPTWGDTLTKQMDQPNSIVGVDTEVINFMVKYRIPGMSIAISKNGKLLYSKGYGFANKSTSKEVTTKTLFRIGKASQLLTSIAIMKLIGDGKFSMDSKVFGDSGILGNEYGALPYGSPIKNITVGQLLHHSAGGWSGNDDPTWNLTYLYKIQDAARSISFTLKNIPLRTPPGSAFAFSDFGYLVLGRIIEKTSGLSYSNFVKEKILKSLGIADMQIEGSSAEEIQKNETIHYSDAIFPILRREKIDDDTYLFTAFGDACYGWIASAEDLLKIVVNLDDSISQTPILPPNALKMLLSPDKTNPRYGCGVYWNSDSTNWYDLGQYRGSTSEIGHTANGYCWSILVNTYRPAIDAYISDMDQIVWHALQNNAFKP